MPTIRFLALLSLFVSVGTQPAVAQQAAKIPLIGIVTGSGKPDEAGSSVKAFRQALQELGYTEGKNILLEFRYVEGKRDRIPGILAELTSLKVDIIFSTMAIVIREAKQATKNIPVVMAVTTDPVAAGLIDSLARPGGNITGVTRLTRDLSGKRLELLTEMIPGLKRVGVLTAVGATTIKDEYVAAARILQVSLQMLEVQMPTPDLSRAFQIAAKGRVGAVIATSAPGLSGSGYHKQMVDLAVEHRLPLMPESAPTVEAGGLVSYDANREDIFKRSAVYVDKILKGAKPADLPVEQPMRFDFVINLKAAKKIGLTIPPNVLVRATRVIR